MKNKDLAVILNLSPGRVSQLRLAKRIKNVFGVWTILPGRPNKGRPPKLRESYTDIGAALGIHRLKVAALHQRGLLIDTGSSWEVDTSKLPIDK